ncbi:MAG: hypothetical protein ACRDHP_14580 [Ktedonobacterales bacterium]
MTTHHPTSPPDIPALLGILHRHGIRYILICSVAALAYGASVAQVGDLDITPALDAENLIRLGRVLQEIEAGLDSDAPFGHWETRQDGERKWVVDAATPELHAQRIAWHLDPADASTVDSLFCSRLGNFDVVPEVSGTYETLMKRAVRLRAWGYVVSVAHVDDLVAALTMPRRPKDAPRVRQLREIQRQRGEHMQPKAGEENGA